MGSDDPGVQSEWAVRSEGLGVQSAYARFGRGERRNGSARSSGHYLPLPGKGHNRPLTPVGDGGCTAGEVGIQNRKACLDTAGLECVCLGTADPQDARSGIAALTWVFPNTAGLGTEFPRCQGLVSGFPQLEAALEGTLAWK